MTKQEEKVGRNIIPMIPSSAVNSKKAMEGIGNSLEHKFDIFCIKCQRVVPFKELKVICRDEGFSEPLCPHCETGDLELLDKQMNVIKSVLQAFVENVKESKEHAQSMQES